MKKTYLKQSAETIVPCPFHWYYQILLSSLRFPLLGYDITIRPITLAFIGLQPSTNNGIMTILGKKTINHP